MNKVSLAMFLSLLSCLSVASGNVGYLEVEDDVVLFSISDSKSGTSPSCVSVGKEDLWSVSLASDSGRAIYSLMLTSMASTEVGLTVESAGDCGVVEGIERAKKVTLEANIVDGGKGSYALYKGDGTRIGEIMTFLSNTEVLYQDENDPTLPASYDSSGERTHLYYSESGCQGEPYILSTGTYYTYSLLNGRYFKNKSYHTDVSVLSWKRSYAPFECFEVEQTRNLYDLEYTEHDLCGEYACVIKQE